MELFPLQFYLLQFMWFSSCYPDIINMIWSREISIPVIKILWWSAQIMVHYLILCAVISIWFCWLLCVSFLQNRTWMPHKAFTRFFATYFETLCWHVHGTVTKHNIKFWIYDNPLQNKYLRFRTYTLCCFSSMFLSNTFQHCSDTISLLYFI